MEAEDSKFETLVRDYLDCMADFDIFDPDGSPEADKHCDKLFLEWTKAELAIYEYVLKDVSRIEQLKKSIEAQQKKIGELS